MPSIIEGYSYDIFISYRQKDNKGDRWVSEFVDALKDELEATFKEDISVYFDENPHDRLQETHDVDKSLEGKLKCLIFIPIISQTYCDPKSYAWQSEFIPFLRMAEKDRFGKDVKLRSGNVASRILPIRIHDLEQEDIKLYEKETGSILRAMDFVFKTTSGVNRPLKANEDHPQDNLNKTYYSDQINKVALAIKEIISGLKTELVAPVKEKTVQREPLEPTSIDEERIEQTKPFKLSKRKSFSGIVIIAIVIVAAIFLYPKVFKRDKLANLRTSDGRISVAVMPFQNMSNDTIWDLWQGGIQDELINSLSISEELKPRQGEVTTGLLKSKGITNYASITPSLASTISQELDANVVVYGSIKQAVSALRLNANIADSKTGDILKSFQIEGPAKEEMIFTYIDSLSVLVKNFLIMSKLQENDPWAKGLLRTNSPESYRYTIYGIEATLKNDNSTAEKWYLEAIKVDSNNLSAITFLSIVYKTRRDYNQAKKWCLIAYEKRDKMIPIDRAWIELNYALLFETINEEMKYLEQFRDMDDQLPHIYYLFGLNYNIMGKYDQVIEAEKKALELYDKWGLTPHAWNYYILGKAYHKTGQYEEAKEIYKKAEKTFPNYLYVISGQAILALTEGDTMAANQYIEQFKSIRRDNADSEAAIIEGLATQIYSDAGMLDKAEECYRQALVLEPENPVIMNSLAFLLIDNDRNISEGLDLVNRALKLRPDNYNYLDIKGWGLYKQGKIEEASVILQNSWDLRMENAIYNHPAFLRLEEVKRAVAGQKNN